MAQETMTALFNRAESRVIGRESQRLQGSLSPYKGVIPAVKNDVGNVFNPHVNKIERNFSLALAHASRGSELFVLDPRFAYHTLWAINHYLRAVAGGIATKTPRK